MSSKQNNADNKTTRTNWKTQSGEKITQTRLADILHRRRTTLSDIINEMPPEALTSLKDALDYIFYRDVLKPKDEIVTMKNMKEQKLFYDVRRARADSRKAEITEERERHQLAVDRGHYIERSEVESRVKEISQKFSTKLFAMPDKVASKLVLAKTAKEVKDILEAEMRKLTEEVDSWPIFP